MYCDRLISLLIISSHFIDHHYGRAVVIVGVPYVYTQSRILKVKLQSYNAVYHYDKQSKLLVQGRVIELNQLINLC